MLLKKYEKKVLKKNHANVNFLLPITPFYHDKKEDRILNCLLKPFLPFASDTKYKRETFGKLNFPSNC